MDARAGRGLTDERYCMGGRTADPLTPSQVRAHSYVVLYTADRQLVGDFHDRLVLEDGVWLFAERRGTLAF